MPLVKHLLAEHSLRPERGRVRLPVERHLFLKRRWRGGAEDGTEFEFDPASRLKHGGVIHQTARADYVIEQQQEAVIQIATPTVAEAALVCWTIMEVCGGQTHSIVRFGLDTLLPDEVTLTRHGCKVVGPMVRDMCGGHLRPLPIRPGVHLPGWPRVPPSH